MKLSLKNAVTGAVTGGMMGGWPGAAAGGAAGLFSSDESADAKSMYNRQLSDSIMLWNMQNAYNTPLAQRQRLIQAGYNPNLWYTQGNTGNAGTISQPSYPSYSQGANSPLNKILSALTVKSAKADTSSKELDNEYKQLQLDYLRAKIKALKTGKVGVSAKDLTGGKSHWLDLFMSQKNRRALLGLWNNMDLVPEENSATSALGNAMAHWLNASSPNSTAGYF